jgi:septal ring factor EnvC (AmiA/AmiB activator)
MKRKLIVTGLVLLGGLWLAKKTSLCSYASVLWARVKADAKEQVPTQVELERVRLEIAGMDKDVSNMLRPIAEQMATINRLKKDIQTSQARLAEQKALLLTITKDLEGNPAMVEYGGQLYSADRVRTKLQTDFDSYKRCEAHLKSQEKLLDAKDRALAATREQLAKIIAKKKEYEVRLAQLEADEETLKIARMGTKVQLDDSRATEIEAILSQIERRHDVQRAELELLSGPQANDFIPVEQRTRTPTKAPDLGEIRNHLQGN